MSGSGPSAGCHSGMSRRGRGLRPLLLLPQAGVWLHERTETAFLSYYISKPVGHQALLFGCGVTHLRVINKKMISTKRYFKMVTM